MIEFEEFQSKLSSLNYSPTTNGGEPFQFHFENTRFFMFYYFAFTLNSLITCATNRRCASLSK